MAKPSGLKVYTVPVVIAAFTFVGLSAALIGGKHWEPLSWISLAVPLAAIVFRLQRAGG